MRSKINRAAYLFVLVSGLISCGKDGSPELSQEAPPAPQATTIEITNPDNSIYRIKNLEALPIDSQIHLQVSDVAAVPDQVLVKSHCITNTHLKKLSHQSVLDFDSQIPVTSLLPIELFQPKETNDRTNQCDIHLDVISKQQPISRIILKQVQIEGLYNFSNFSDQIVQNKKPGIILRRLMRKKTLQWPFDQGDIYTLCETETSIQPLKSNSTSMLTLFPTDLFRQKNLQLCRLLGIDSSTGALHITPKFYVQNEESSLQIKKKNLFNVNPTADSILRQYQIYNRGKAPSYIRFKVRQPRISMTPAYSQSNGVNGFVKAPQIQIKARWSIDTVSDSMRLSDHAQSILIKPGETITLTLKATHSVDCSPFRQMSFTPSPNTDQCSGMRLVGAFFSIGNSLDIKHSRFEHDKNHQHLVTRTIREPKFDTLWAAFSPGQNLCPKMPLIKKAPKLWTPDHGHFLQRICQ